MDSTLALPVPGPAATAAPLSHRSHVSVTTSVPQSSVPLAAVLLSSPRKMGILDAPGGVVVEDEDHTVHYTGDWRTLTSTDNRYHGGIIHYTTDASASASFTFNGSHIYYYSNFNDDHGRYSAAVDDGAPTMLSTQSGTLQLVQKLFDQETPPGSHTIKLQNLENKILAIDFFVYLPLVSSGTSTSTPASVSLTTPLHAPTQSPPAHSTVVPPAAIVGIAMSCVAVIAFCCLLFIAIRNSRRKAALSQFADTWARTRATPWVQPVHSSRAGLPRDGLAKQYRDSSSS